MKKLSLPIILSLILLVICLAVFFYKQVLGQGLFFVDAGRFAIVAKNLLNLGEFRTTFEFYPHGNLNQSGWVSFLPPIHIITIALFMKVFGVNDQAVIFESFTFFILTLIMTYFLARKVFNSRVAIFATAFTALTPQMLGYSKDGASEPLFTFLVISAIYLLYIQKRWSLFISGIFLSLALFTKLQSYILIPLIIIWAWLLTRKILNVGMLIIPLATLFVLNKLGLVFGYYYIWIPQYLLLQQSLLFPGDNITRSDAVMNSQSLVASNIKVVISKFLYNMYNFYKILIPQDPSLPAFTVPLVNVSYLFSNINIFVKSNKPILLFRIFTLLMLVGLLVLSALTSPNIRYAHIMIPLVTILAVDFLYTVINFICDKSIFKENKHLSDWFIAAIFVIFFVIPFLGKYLLDTRYENLVINIDKPYVGKVLGEDLGNLTSNDSIVLTNLHTWGSWYGDRKTMLMPIDISSFERFDQDIKFKYIFLTDYDRYNQDRPLSGEWGDLFDNPSSIKNQYIKDNFEYVKEATVSASQVFENNPTIYKLWSRKTSSDDREIYSIN